MARTAASRSSTEHPRRRAPWGFLILLLVLPGAAAGQDYVPRAGSVEGRLARVERLLDNRGLLDLLGEVEKLSREIRRLRGEMEVQRHGLDRQSARQERLYKDVEARLEAIERGTAHTPPTDGAATSAAVAPTAPATPTVENVPAPGAEPGASRADESARGATPEIGDPPVPGSAPLTVAAAQPLSEDASYQSAFDLLKIGQYDKSITAFGDFLTRFPDSPHADNAQYWLAEAYYVTHRYEPAISEYQKLVGSYPESQKLTHALLKVGYSYHELGKIAEAKQSLEDLKLRYPGTTAAKLADERLQRIRLEHQ